MDGIWNIFLYDMENGSERQLTFVPLSSFDPVISPDGRFIAYAANTSGSTDIWVMDMEKLSPVHVVTHGAVDCQPVWTKDGKDIIFASNRVGENFDLYMISAPEDLVEIASNVQAEA